MKSKASIISILMTTMLANPLGVHAEDPKENIESLPQKPGQSVREEAQVKSEISKEKLEQILTDLKKRLVILDKEAEFRYSVGFDEGQNYYNLSWSTDAYSQEVRYGDDKNIYSYSHYMKNEPYRENELKKLPKFSKTEAEAIASNFVKLSFPSEYSNFVRVDDLTISGKYYYANYQYKREGIPVQGISANVTIDAVTGKVTSFYTNYSSVIKFDSPKGVISEKEAQSIYRSKVGLKKIYTWDYDEKSGQLTNIKMVYVPGLDNTYSINGKTGQVEKIPFYMGYGGMGGAKEMSSMQGDNGITPQERKEIEKKSGLKTMEEARSAASRLGLFDKDALFTGSNLYERAYSDIGYSWNLSFLKNDIYYNVELDARTLQLVSYYGEITYDSQKIVTSQALSDAKKAGQAFIAKYAGKYQNKLELNEMDLSSQVNAKTSTVRLEYTRIENGAYLPGDGISITYNVLTGKVAEFRLNWAKVQLPVYTKLADENKILDKILNENGIELNYKLRLNEATRRNDGKLYYDIAEKPGLPLMFSAETGERISQEAQAGSKISYSDLNDSRYKNEIAVLAGLGIGFEGGRLLPAKAVSQREYLDLLLQTKEYYYGPVPRSSDAKEDIKKYVDAGLLVEGEKLSDSVIARQEAAKYLVRAAGYEKVARNPEIFKSTLADFDKTDTPLKGYVAIADVLKYTDTQGGPFNPKHNATREAVLKMIYNYLALQ